MLTHLNLRLRIFLFFCLLACGAAAIAGGAMAKIRALWGGGLLVLSALGMYVAFGFNPFTMFPIAFAALGGVLAIAAGKPHEPKSHF